MATDHTKLPLSLPRLAVGEDNDSIKLVLHFLKLEQWARDEGLHAAMCGNAAIQQQADDARIWARRLVVFSFDDDSIRRIVSLADGQGDNQQAWYCFRWAKTNLI